jgi:hypothetical protein
MGYFTGSLLAELGKLSQGKPTQLPAEMIAHWAIDEIRGVKRALRDDDLERLFELPDPRR